MSSQHSIACSLDHAINLNNEGVRQTLAGCDEIAVGLFSNALCVFKSLISRDTSNDNSPSRSLLHDCTDPLPRFNESNFFLFSRVVSFTTTPEQKPADNHIYCSAIILNIALIYHRQAVLGHRDALVKAERFYEMVTKIVSGNAADQGTGLMIRLAAINNLAQIRFERGDYQAAEAGFQLLAWLVSSSEVENGSVLHLQDLEGMLLNALMANTQTAAAAA